MLQKKEPHDHCCQAEPVALAANSQNTTPLPHEYLAGIEALTDKLLKQLHSNPNMPPSVTADLQQETGATLVQAIKKGYNKDFDNIDYQSPDNEMIAYLQNNMYAFSAAKTFAQIQELQKLLTDPDTGNPVPFAKFKDAALAINRQYNIAHMYAEYNHAIAAAQMASAWLQIEKDSEDFPYLQYTTAGDERVRAQHATLNNIVLPVNSSFWDTYYPPNGWNCRCNVIQLTQDQALKKGITDENNAKSIAAKDAVTQKLFAMNSGKSKVVYSNQHPYFSSLGKANTELSATKNYGMKTIKQIYEQQNIPQLPQTTINSYQELQEWWKQNQDENGAIQIQTPLSAKVILDKKLLKHLRNTKQIEEKRYELIGAALAALQNPNEVWQNFNQGKQQGSASLNTLFIKYYKDSVIVVAVANDNGKQVVKTFYSAQATEQALSAKRTGILIKKQ